MKRANIIRTALAGIVALWAASTFAWTTFPPESPAGQRKVRNLGMGNAGVAIRGSHDSSPFYNPAGLNDLEDSRYQFLTTTFEIAENSIGLIGDTKNLIDDIDAATTDAEKTTLLNNFINERSGEFNHLRFALDIFNYSRKNFAAGLLIDERLDISFREASTYTHFDIRNLGDASLYLAGGYGWWDDLLQVGLTLRPIVRFSLDEADQTVDYTDVVSEDADGDPLIKGQFSNMKDPHFGIGVDLGLKSNLAIPGLKDLGVYKWLKPAVGLTWQDIGTSDFGGAPDAEQSISVGFAVHPDVWKLRNTVALDFRDLNQERDVLGMFHFGVESVLDWAVDVGLRAGVSQGYFTAGLTLDFKYVRLDGAYYMEEVGTLTKQDGSARYAVTLAFNI